VKTKLSIEWVEARSLEDFLAHPFGSYFASGPFLVWCRDPELGGTVVFDRLESADMARLTRALDFVVHPGMRPYRVLADLRGLRVSDPSPFVALSAYVQSRLELLSRLLRAQAVLRPTNEFSALIVDGFFTKPEANWRVFGDAEEALSWLREEPGLLEGIEDLTARARATSSIVRRLRTALGDDPAKATLAGVASSLGVSARSLQRELSAARSSFSRELQAARLSAARELLLKSPLKISAIAQTVGFASVRHFTELFKRTYGVTPNEWRERESG
jgi:AraC-like DNA-binding protein